jgi:hypothetical protein
MGHLPVRKNLHAKERLCGHLARLGLLASGDPVERFESFFGGSGLRGGWPQCAVRDRHRIWGACSWFSVGKGVSGVRLEPKRIFTLCRNIRFRNIRFPSGVLLVGRATKMSFAPVDEFHGALSSSLFLGSETSEKSGGFLLLKARNRIFFRCKIQIPNACFNV